MNGLYLPFNYAYIVSVTIKRHKQLNWSFLLNILKAYIIDIFCIIVYFCVLLYFGIIPKFKGYRYINTHIQLLFRYIYLMSFPLAWSTLVYFFDWLADGSHGFSFILTDSRNNNKKKKGEFTSLFTKLNYSQAICVSCTPNKEAICDDRCLQYPHLYA